MSIGLKGAICVARAMAFTVSDLFKSDKLIKKVKDEFLMRKGDHVYKPMIDGPPPINQN